METLRRLQKSGMLNVEAYPTSPEHGGFTECITGLGSAALAEMDHPGWASNFLAGDNRATSVPESDRNGRSQVHNVRSASGLDSRTDRPIRDDSDLPKYTMTMYEVVDSQGRRPQYDFERLSLDPPLFEATLRHEGCVYKGEASTKKEAKHLASRNACFSKGLL